MSGGYQRVMIVLDVVLEGDADPGTVAEQIIDFLADTDDTQTPGVISFDGVEWKPVEP